MSQASEAPANDAQRPHQLVASLCRHNLDIRAHLCQRCDWRSWPGLIRVRCSYRVGHLQERATHVWPESEHSFTKPSQNLHLRALATMTDS